MIDLLVTSIVIIGACLACWCFGKSGTETKERYKGPRVYLDTIRYADPRLLRRAKTELRWFDMRTGTWIEEKGDQYVSDNGEV